MGARKHENCPHAPVFGGSLLSPLFSLHCSRTLRTRTHARNLQDIVTINFGKGADDPVKGVVWYKMHRQTGAIEATRLSAPMVSNFVPLVFQEQYLRVYCRRREAEHIANFAFKLWCKQHGCVCVLRSFLRSLSLLLHWPSHHNHFFLHCALLAIFQGD